MDTYEYLALAIDLEGVINIGKARYRDRYYYNPQVRITSTSLKILYSIKDKTKLGKVNTTAKYFENRNYSYYWELNNYEMREHLPKLKEYLIIKSEQCQNAIDLLNMKRTIKDRKGKVAQYYTEELFKRMEQIYQINKELNSRAFRPLSDQDELFRQLMLFSR